MMTRRRPTYLVSNGQGFHQGGKVRAGLLLRIRPSSSGPFPKTSAAASASAICLFLRPCALHGVFSILFLPYAVEQQAGSGTMPCHWEAELYRTYQAWSPGHQVKVTWGEWPVPHAGLVAGKPKQVDERACPG